MLVELSLNLCLAKTKRKSLLSVPFALLIPFFVSPLIDMRRVRVQKRERERANGERIHTSRQNGLPQIACHKSDWIHTDGITYMRECSDMNNLFDLCAEMRAIYVCHICTTSHSLLLLLLLPLLLLSKKCGICGAAALSAIACEFFALAFLSVGREKSMENLYTW